MGLGTEAGRGLALGVLQRMVSSRRKARTFKDGGGERFAKVSSWSCSVTVVVSTF